jgi:hypothetical protein
VNLDLLTIVSALPCSEFSVCQGDNLLFQWSPGAFSFEVEHSQNLIARMIARDVKAFHYLLDGRHFKFSKIAENRNPRTAKHHYSEAGKRRRIAMHGAAASIWFLP